jgi:hypothetical protein
MARKYVVEVVRPDAEGMGIVARFIADDATLGPRCASIASLGWPTAASVTASPCDELPVPGADSWAAFLEQIKETIERRDYPIFPWGEFARVMATLRPQRPHQEERACLH